MIDLGIVKLNNKQQNKLAPKINAQVWQGQHKSHRDGSMVNKLQPFLYDYQRYVTHICTIVDKILNKNDRSKTTCSNMYH